MNKLYKTLFALLGLLIVVAVAALVLVAMNIGNIVKSGINDYSKPVLGIAMTVDGVDVNLLQGKLALQNFRVANPPGFSDLDSISVDQLDVALDLNSLRGRVIVIENIQVSGVQLLAEQKGADINLLALKKTLQKKANSAAKSVSSKTASSANATKQAEASQGGYSPRFAITRFALGDSKALVKSEFGKDQQLAVPGFELNNLGSREQGISVEQAVNQILQPLLTAVIEKAKDEALKKGVEQKLEKELKKAIGDDKTVNAVKDLLKGL